VFNQLIDFGRQTLFLLRDVDENKKEIADLKRELEATNELVRQLAYEIQRVSEREMHEREKLKLQLENALLRFERQLPQKIKKRK